MSNQPLGAYTFLPWARQGLGIHIQEEDGADVSLRGSIAVNLQITGEKLSGGNQPETIERNVQLYGPADVVGIDANAIVRTEPRNWITNFEPNYLPFIEFYEEDFPWRYTPASPSSDNKHLRPWITLVVLEESEWDKSNDDKRNMLGRKLRYIKVTNPQQSFPPADQLWAWAHLHINGALDFSGNNEQLAAQLEETLRTNRDRAYSRLMCPRVLKESTSYDAFLIPTFETGRLAGLNGNPADAEFATQSAWEDETGPKDFPYYYRWYFRTGSVGDFEYLVRLLQGRAVDPRVGRRDMDTQRPGPNLRGISELGGILRLGGALRPPLDKLSEDDLEEYKKFEEWSHKSGPPHPFQDELASLVNLANDYSSKTAAAANTASGLDPNVAGDDPLIVPPIYGRWHSETSRLDAADADPAKKKWVQELNLDPRHRVTAGFGTNVVQKNQEKYMEAAWQQVGSVIEANQRIRHAQMAKLVSDVWHSRVLTRIKTKSRERFLAITAPLHQRVVTNGFTVRHSIRQSTLPTAMMSKTMRQALRPRGRVSRLLGFDPTRTATNLLRRVNQGQVKAAPPKVVAGSLPTGGKLGGLLENATKPSKWLDMLSKNPWFARLGFVRDFVDRAAASSPEFVRDSQTMRDALSLLLNQTTPDTVKNFHPIPNFTIGDPDEASGLTQGNRDSAEATRFKESLSSLYSIDRAESRLGVAGRQPLSDLTALAENTLKALNPELTIPARVLHSIQIPAHIREQLREPFGEVMVYPKIDQPMYEPLKGISSELFLPNINLIPNNSITLLEPNRKFIEAYMVGVNHEFARELLWREYPTDQRGSYFRQFWDVRGFLPGANADPEAVRENLYDIQELHKWKGSELGEYDTRSPAEQDTLVLVIRGELLKKYPTAVIYAHRAEWNRTGGETKRQLKELEPNQEADPPRDVIKTPLYEAKVDPDVYFFGFDLTDEQACGGPAPNGDPGWFFVIKERPGEPRFGLDLPQPAPRTTLNTWNDLAWTDVMTPYTPGAFLQPGGGGDVGLSQDADGSDEEVAQHEEDLAYDWRPEPETTSAELAYILCQVPVLIAFHASDMLEQAR